MITKMKDNIVKKIDYVYVEALDKKIPNAYCQIFQGIIKGKKGRGSVAEQLQQFGDIITKNDDKKIKSQKQCEELLTKIDKNDYNFKINGIRLTTNSKMEENRFPEGCEQSAIYKYHIAAIYLIYNCKFALSVKSYNNKVFVTCIVEHILAGMSLTVGDAKILNVDSVPVTTVTGKSNAICVGLRKNECITLINKQPNYTLAAAYVRYTLMVEKSVEMDLSFAPAVIDIY
ncbi:hypothetical protein X798_08231 [Onchocerca flexuosa]|uniref:PDZ domain-containing protein n=1 Tax=Onchocerca flexuosa TaxID=387005 RepID=A0A238BH55_9BILA|nr:hypothetical protein X798_08231 [Onchocerca flexuosa]